MERRSKSQLDEFSKLINSVSQETEKYKYSTTETKPNDFMSTEKCSEVLQKYSNLHDIPLEHTIAGITKLIQDGGTNQSKKNLTVVVGDKEFELNKLRDILKSIDKTLTVRKFAKGARDIIIKVAQINGWPGPLTKELIRVNQNLLITPDLAPWCLEIHSDNYNCPNEIRDALVRREEQLKLFLKTREVKNKTRNQPRQQRGKKNKKR
jgi:hypothetical protein